MRFDSETTIKEFFFGQKCAMAIYKCTLTEPTFNNLEEFITVHCLSACVRSDEMQVVTGKFGSVLANSKAVACN